MNPAKFTKYFANCKGVFQGGGCKAIAYIGAYRIAYERGVFFSELAGTSAGSIIASFIACGAKPEYIENVVKKLNFNDFISTYKPATWFERFVFKRIFPQNYKQYAKYCSLSEFLLKFGIFKADAIEHFVDFHLKKLMGLNRSVTFEDLLPNLHIVCADLEKRSVKVWNKDNTPTESVAKAVSCSCCIPLYFQPIDNKYVDGGVLSNLPSFIFAKEPHYNRILNFRLDSENSSTKITSVKDFASSLIGTVIEGACNIQQSLNIDSFDVSIKVTDINSVDFEKINIDIINSLIESGEQAMSNFLDEEFTFISANSTSKRTLKSKEQMRSLVSYISLEKHKEIYVSCDNTLWCWELFLSLTRWISFGTKITIITSSSINEQYKEEEEARRRMLKAMGCNLRTVNTILITGYFFLEKENVWRGIVFHEASGSFTANYYNGFIDSILIRDWVLKLKKDLLGPWITPCKISIKPVKYERIIEKLRTESIYENARLKFETVDLENLYFMNPYIRALKYRQIDKMYEFYENKNLSPFTAAALYFNDKESLIGPPIAEMHNGRLYVIEGNTRCLYAYKHGIKKLQVLVVTNVSTPIPCDTKKTYKISDILISDTKISAGDRYQDFNYSLFRHIEESIRPHKSYML